MSTLKHHKTLSLEKWQKFSAGQQILMIGNELNRAGHWIQKHNLEEVKLCYERAMELLNLTLATTTGYSKLRELARFQEVLAALYLEDAPELESNRQAQKVLISLSGESYSLLHPK